MTLTISSVRCSLQVALLGAITPNLRTINVNIIKDSLKLYFYYQIPPSEEEEDLSEIVVTKLYSNFINISIKIHRIVLAPTNKVPEIGIRIFHRKE